MKFRTIPTQRIPTGKVIYEGYNFDFEPHGDLKGITSLAIDDLQLEIDHTGRVLYVWDYCPYQDWIYTDRLPPSSTPGILIVIPDAPIIPGVSRRLKERGAWPVFVNPKHGWICIGDLDVPEPFESVEFVRNTIAVLKESDLKAIWLRPEELPDEIALSSGL